MTLTFMVLAYVVTSLPPRCPRHLLVSLCHHQSISPHLSLYSRPNYPLILTFPLFPDTPQMSGVISACPPSGLFCSWCPTVPSKFHSFIFLLTAVYYSIFSCIFFVEPVLHKNLSLPHLYTFSPSYICFLLYHLIFFLSLPLFLKDKKNLKFL